MARSSGVISADLCRSSRSAWIACSQIYHCHLQALIKCRTSSGPIIYNEFFIARRPVPNAEGQEVIYFSMRTITGMDFLAELTFKQGDNACKVCFKTDNAAYGLSAKSALEKMLRAKFRLDVGCSRVPWYEFKPSTWTDEITSSTWTESKMSNYDVYIH